MAGDTIIRQKRGRPPKTLDQRLRDGTFSIAKHGHLVNRPALMVKPDAVTKGLCGRPQQWVRNVSDELAIKSGCYFDEKAAAYVVEWMAKNLSHCKGQWAGKPFELLPWQRNELIYPLFGWMRADGRRRFRISYIQVPKKNGKSALCSAVGLYMLCGDGEQGAKCYSLATDKDQASIVHGEAIKMAEASANLRDHLRINYTSKVIAHDATGSLYAAKSSVAAGSQGLDASCTIIDELHAWKGRDLWDSLKYAGSARTQPLRLVITTAGDDSDCVCYQQYDYAKQVIAGAIEDERYFAFITELAEDEDFRNPKTWPKCNPSFGTILDAQDFAQDVQEALRTPSTTAAMLRYRFNRWTSAIAETLPPEAWRRCALAYSEAELGGRACYGGLDLSQTTDSTALVLVFKIEGTYWILSYHWLPEAAVAVSPIRDELVEWARQGFLKIVPGNVIDYDLVYDELARLKGIFKIRGIAFDPMYAEQLTQQIESKLGIGRHAFPQTMMSFAAPWSEFERAVLACALRHPSHPLLTRQLSHTRVKTDANQNKRPVRSKKGDQKPIDAVVALVMGIGAWLELGGKGSGESVYNRRGAIVL